MNEIRALHPSELEAWFDLLAEQFTVPRAYFERHWRNDPWRDLNGIRVAVADGRILASVRVFRRQLYLGGVESPVGGIGEVCTRVEARGQGLSGTLLRDAIVWMEQEGLPLSLLFADLHGHYGRYGWQIVPIETGVTYLGASATLGPFLTTGLERASLPTLAALYDSFNQRLQGGLVRSPDYWADWWMAEQGVTRIAWQGDRPVGYLAAKLLGNGDLLVQDFAVGSGVDPGRLLLQLGAEAAEALGAEPTAGLLYPRATCPGLEPEEVRQQRGAMLRVIRPDLLSPEVSQLVQEAMSTGRPDWLWWPVDGF